jgi:ribosomal protein S8
MSMQDPIADMLTRIRNGQAANSGFAPSKTLTLSI